MIRTIYVATCGKCGGFSPSGWERLSTGLPTTRNLAATHFASSEHDAVAVAVQQGWQAYPLLCPACSDAYRSTLREGRDEQQDRGPVREPGEGPERAGRGG